MRFDRASRYLLALGILVLAVLVRVGLNPWLGTQFPYPVVPIAVLISAWYCGAGPAAAVAVLGYVGVEYLVRDAPLFSWRLGYLFPSALILLGVNVLIIVFVVKVRREHDALSHALESWKRSEAKLNESERRMRATFNNAPIGITETDARRRFVAVNDRMCRMLGYSREELLGMTVQDVTAPEDRPESEDLSTELRLGRVDRYDGDKRYLRKDGSSFWGHVTASAVRDEAGGFLYAIAAVEDISERKRTEEALRATRKAEERARIEAEEANQAKDHFLAVLSHELRTPLTPVLAAVQLMQRKPDLDGQMQRKSLEIIRRNVQLEARLIDDLLDLTRIVQGKLILQRKPIDLCTVIERVVEVCRTDIEARRVHFGVDMGGGPYPVNGDLSRLQQVIWNLVTNAVKFTPENGRVGVRCWREGDRAVVEVNDSGIGIDADSLERIFDAFEQGGRAITRQFGGLGLGLAIAKRLVEMHQGTICVHSEGRNKGATFRVSLPLAERYAAQAEQPALATAPGTVRILLVEDNGDTAAMMKLLLEACGYRIDTVGDVSQALEAIQTKSFDVLISDLGLPDRSGAELMQELRRRGSRLKGIALSGYGREDDVRRSKEAGFSEHLTKPVEADALLATVSRVLELPLQ